MPPATQLPADGQESAVTWASPPVFSVPVPRAFPALPQLPFFCVARKAWLWPFPSRYRPPAAQLPAAPQDRTSRLALPPALIAARPGSWMALPQCPFFSVTAKAESELLLGL